jgi:ParB family chromosome partitioning protein
MNRTTLPINEILVIDRQRIDLGDIAELADSITRFGLIQPIVVNQDKRLIAGGRRLAAHQHLGRTHIDVVFRETLSTDELHELELEENVRRREMSWQERALNILQIHELKTRRSAIEGSRWGMRETAEMLNIRGQSNVHYNNEIAKRLRAELLLPDATARRYWACENMSRAWQLRLRDEEDLVAASLAKDTAIATQITQQPVVKPLAETTLDDLLPAVDAETYTASVAPGPVSQPPNTYLTGYAPIIPPPDLAVPCPLCNGLATGCGHCKQTGLGWRPGTGPGQITLGPVYAEYKTETIALSSLLHHCSCIDYMLAYPSSVDHIITDPPYGIDMDMLNQGNDGHAFKDIDTVEAEHTVSGNEELFTQLMPAAYNVLKPNGYFILWADMMQWQRLYDLATSAGFRVQRWPITWVKTHRCMNQSIDKNFTKTTEIAMVCRKGTASMATRADECHILAAHDDYKDTLGHPFVKPFDVWQYLINHVSYEGQTILEPFSGRGSGVLSILRCKRRVISCELNDAHFNALVENVKQHYLTINPNYQFK